MPVAKILQTERGALCETLDAVGPEGPTLCEGWLAADVAAHLVIFDRRPDGAPGIGIGGVFGRHTLKLMERFKDRGFDWMVDKLRGGPPRVHGLWPLGAVSVFENWAHHEDVRRGAGSAPRPEDSEIDDMLWKLTGMVGRLVVRRVKGTGIEIVDGYGRRKLLSKSEPRVTVTGPTGEVALYLLGRKDAAEVALSGPPDAVASVNAANFEI